MPEDRDVNKTRPVGEILEQTDALKKHIEKTGYPPLEEVERFMDTLKEGWARSPVNSTNPSRTSRIS